MEIACPGCGLRMPRREGDTNPTSFNASAECWSVFTEVIGAEFSNAFLFGQVHQLTVDAYAVQHAGGAHRDKSVDVHLAGLYFVIGRGLAPTEATRHMQALAGRTDSWPHLKPPLMIDSLTVFDVAMAGSIDEHIARVREWSAAVWQAWSPHHAAIAELIGE